MDMLEYFYLVPRTVNIRVISHKDVVFISLSRVRNKEKIPSPQKLIILQCSCHVSMRQVRGELWVLLSRTGIFLSLAIDTMNTKSFLFSSLFKKFFHSIRLDSNYVLVNDGRPYSGMFLFLTDY